ncbi:uncharacterized protein FIBRA_05912 [Fibroporia radiculosa]|uniref:Uncharacterized protein n=1 Tax=Fibroporia radiculosa TaxID=599839 RepID=J4GRU7_9APHY|nr:uncharacterized protein FIBRA_05912 [Fibroporia radiculosa]CCM03765.1 predicted protein [Fibroporia radiculosa]
MIVLMFSLLINTLGEDIIRAHYIYYVLVFVHLP